MTKECWSRKIINNGMMYEHTAWSQHKEVTQTTLKLIINTNTYLLIKEWDTEIKVATYTVTATIRFILTALCLKVNQT